MKMFVQVFKTAENPKNTEMSKRKLIKNDETSLKSKPKLNVSRLNV